MFARIALIGSLVAVVACDAHLEDRQDVTGAVWSDDDLEVAAFRREYSVLIHDEIKGGEIERLMDMTFTPIARDLATGAEREIGGSYAGTPRRLHFMRSAGYLSIAFEIGAEVDIIDHFERIDLATGEAVELRAPCSRIADLWCSALPSPDGALIAIVEKALVGSRTRVELRRASDGGIAAEAEVPAAEAGDRMTWHPSGAFVFSVNSETGETWQLSEDGTLAVVPVPPCFSPATTSSAVSSQGRVLLADGTLGGELAEPFGCQAR
ncbi:MAG: hypothetical protein AB7P03_03810 [Kofleriaceae bacterium]